jgi:hypothetical protein
MQVHLATALLAVPFAVWHGVTRDVLGLPGKIQAHDGIVRSGSGSPEPMSLTQWLNDSSAGVDRAGWILSSRTG